VETTYKATTSTRAIGIAAGLLFIGVGVAIIAWRMASTESSSIAGIPCPCGAILIGGILIGAGAAAIGSSLWGVAICVTADAIEQRQGRQVIARYPYDQITAVRLAVRQQALYRTARLYTYYYPLVRLEGQFDTPTPLTLPLSYSGIADATGPVAIPPRYSQKATYDVRGILRDLLPRLPSSVEIDPNLWAYSQGGELPDLHTLPVDTTPQATWPLKRA